jgi:hypothetical protein
VWLVCDAVRTSELDIHFDPVTIDISPARGSRRTRGSRCPLGLKLASEKTDGGRCTGSLAASQDKRVELRGRRHDPQVTLCAFDLIELDGGDLRREPLERRKAMLAQLVSKPLPGLVLNATYEEPGDVVFKHACALGFEGMVSKRLGSRYTSGRSRDWLKCKNPQAPAVKREAEEEWGKERWQEWGKERWR